MNSSRIPTTVLFLLSGRASSSLSRFVKRVFTDSFGISTDFNPRITSEETFRKIAKRIIISPFEPAFFCQPPLRCLVARGRPLRYRLASPQLQGGAGFICATRFFCLQSQFYCHTDLKNLKIFLNIRVLFSKNCFSNLLMIIEKR